MTPSYYRLIVQTLDHCLFHATDVIEVVFLHTFTRLTNRP